MLQLQGCARRSIALLDRAAAGQQTFDTLFLSNQSPLTIYDYLLHVTVPSQDDGQLQTLDAPTWQQAEKKVEAVVKQVSCMWTMITSCHPVAGYTRRSS